MHALSLILDTVLTVYVSWEVLRFSSRYRQLKQAIARGDQSGRKRLYQKVLAFEWISASLALAALGFDWNQLNPRSLSLNNIEFLRSLSGGAFSTGLLGGLLAGMIAGTLGFVVARMKANRRSALPAGDKPMPRWRKLLPDFSAMLPTTTQERLLWAAVAISAGICEEIVFRGWLLATLHSKAGLAGAALILVAAALFGLAHAYQGLSGMLLTAFAGLVFCILFITTGSLLMPVLVHILVDLRFVLLPAQRAVKPSASYA